MVGTDPKHLLRPAKVLRLSAQKRWSDDSMAFEDKSFYNMLCLRERAALRKETAKLSEGHGMSRRALSLVFRHGTSPSLKRPFVSKRWPLKHFDSWALRYLWPMRLWIAAASTLGA
eukprot:s8093_g2.t1